MRKVLLAAVVWLAVGVQPSGCSVAPEIVSRQDPSPGTTPARAPGAFSAGPLFDRFALTLAPGERTEIAGPLFSFERRESQREWALHPLFSWTRDAELDRREFDLLYPLLTHDRFGDEYQWQFLQVLRFSGGPTQAEDEVSRFTLFPLYFQQRATDRELNYTALFPFYGTLKNRFLRDEIYFALFPIYARTERKGATTQNVLYPVFHLRRGESLEGWQVWPLTGFERKEPLTRTNRFGDAEVSPGHKKFFALWPIYFRNELGLGTEDTQTLHAVLPLYTMSRSPQRDSFTAPWPIGFTRTEDREKNYREWGFPWPLWVIARGDDRHITRFWPLYSRAQSGKQESDFYLWPLYMSRRYETPSIERERRRVLFFLYSEATERAASAEFPRRRVDFWPLFTTRQDFDGNSRLQILAPIEPILPNHKSIERNYSPLWSIWRSEKHRRTGASSQSLLWNLYRRDRAPESTKCSLLFGLFQYESGPQDRRFRLFFIPVGKAAGERSDGVME